jgi:hypothetical protein
MRFIPEEFEPLSGSDELTESYEADVRAKRPVDDVSFIRDADSRMIAGWRLACHVCTERCSTR